MFKSTLLSLLAAASQAKKEALEKKYLVSQGFVEICANIDPTPNGQYTEWLVKVLRHDENVGPALQDELKDALEEFGRLKNSAAWATGLINGKPKNNILSYANFNDLISVIQESSPDDYSKKERERDLQRRRKQYLAEGCEEIGSPGEGVVCYEPTTVRAVQLMGEGSHWCTKNPGYAQRYLSRGAIYVFTTEEKESSYESDRYLQIHVPDDSVTGFEAQDADGEDIGNWEIEDKCYQVNDEWWGIVQWLSNYDRDLERYIREGFIFNDINDMAHFEKCDQCDAYMETDSYDTIYVNNDDSPDKESHNFCCEGCFKEFYNDIIEKKVKAFVATIPGKEERNQKAMDDAEELIYGTGWDPKATKVFRAMHEAAIRMGLPNTVNHHYALDWYLANLTSGIRAFENGQSDRVEKVTPGLTLGDYKWALKVLQPVYDELMTYDTLYDDILEYVKDQFTPTSTDIDDIIENSGMGKVQEESAPEIEGEIATDELEPTSEPSEKLKKSSLSNFKSALLKFAAASEAKKKALASKYHLPPHGVDTLSLVDPSQNGEYLEWLCRETRKAMDDPEGRSSLAGTMKRDDIKIMLERYAMLKRSANFTGEKDIMKLGLSDLKEIYDTATRADLSKNEQGRELIREKDKYLRDGCEPLAKTRGYSFYRCTTPEALVLMSTGSHWCTQGEGTAEAYLERGPLYVITQDSGTNEHYGSDRYALIRVPTKNIQGQGVGAIECQDVDGRNIGDQIFSRDPFSDSADVGQKYDVDSNYWWIFETLAEFDPKIKESMEQKIIFPGAWDINNDNDLYEDHEDQELTNCANCDEPVAEEDAIYLSGNPYCCSYCVREYFRPAINRLIDKFLPNADENKKRRARTYIEEQLNINGYDDLEAEREKILVRGGFCQKCEDCHEAIPAGNEINYKKGSFCAVSCFISYYMQDMDDTMAYIQKKLGMDEDSHFQMYDEKIAERAIRNETMGIDSGFYQATLQVLLDTRQITEQQLRELSVKKASLLIKQAYGGMEKYYPREQFIEELQEFILENLSGMTPLRSFKKHIEDQFGQVYHLGTTFKLDKDLWDKAMQGLRSKKQVEVVTAITPYSKAASVKQGYITYIKKVADDSDEIIEETKKEHYGQEVIMDLHDVDPDKFQTHILKKFAEDLCDEIDMQRGPIYSWGQDKFEGTYKTHPKKDGISVVQFLYESSITIHALDELQKIFINVFSCKDFDPEKAKAFALKTLGGNLVTEHNIVRN